MRCARLLLQLLPLVLAVALCLLLLPTVSVHAGSGASRPVQLDRDVLHDDPGHAAAVDPVHAAVDPVQVAHDDTLDATQVAQVSARAILLASGDRDRLLPTLALMLQLRERLPWLHFTTLGLSVAMRDRGAVHALASEHGFRVVEVEKMGVGVSVSVSASASAITSTGATSSATGARDDSVDVASWFEEVEPELKESDLIFYADSTRPLVNELALRYLVEVERKRVIRVAPVPGSDTSPSKDTADSQSAVDILTRRIQALALDGEVDDANLPVASETRTPTLYAAASDMQQFERQLSDASSWTSRGTTQSGFDWMWRRRAEPVNVGSISVLGEQEEVTEEEVTKEGVTEEAPPHGADTISDLPTIVTTSAVFAGKTTAPSSSDTVVYAGVLPYNMLFSATATASATSISTSPSSDLTTTNTDLATFLAQPSDTRPIIFIARFPSTNNISPMALNRKLCGAIELLHEKFRFIWQTGHHTRRLPSGISRKSACVEYVQMLAVAEVSDLSAVSEQLAMVVHSGTSMMAHMALAAGLPALVLVPSTTESNVARQYFAERTMQLNLGVTLAAGSVSSEQLAAAMETVVADVEISKAVRAAKEHVMQEMEGHAAVALVERVLQVGKTSTMSHHGSNDGKPASSNSMHHNSPTTTKPPCLTLYHEFFIQTFAGLYCRIIAKQVLFALRLICDQPTPAEATPFFFTHPTHTILSARRYASMPVRSWDHAALAYETADGRVFYVAPSVTRQRGYRIVRSLNVPRVWTQVQVVAHGPGQGGRHMVRPWVEDAQRSGGRGGDRCIRHNDLVRFRFPRDTVLVVDEQTREVGIRALPRYEVANEGVDNEDNDNELAGEPSPFELFRIRSFS